MYHRIKEQAWDSIIKNCFKPVIMSGQSPALPRINASIILRRVESVSQGKLLWGGFRNQPEHVPIDVQASGAFIVNRRLESCRENSAPIFVVTKKSHTAEKQQSTGK